MNFSKLLKGMAFLGLISTGISASAAPVSCTWQYAGGGGANGYYTSVDVCLAYTYNGSQITGATHIASRTRTYANGYQTSCTITPNSGYWYTGSCSSPSFYTSTTLGSSSSRTSSSSSSVRSILFTAICPMSPQTDLMTCMESNGRRCGSMNGVGVGSNQNFTCYAK